MSYRVVLPKSVQKELDRLPDKEAGVILERIKTLEQNPRPNNCLKLAGHDNEYRIRIGDYRAIYQILENEKVVVLLHCRHRKDVYRQ